MKFKPQSARRSRDVVMEEALQMQLGDISRSQALPLAMGYPCHARWLLTDGLQFAIHR